MAIYLSSEKKAEIFREYAGSEKNTGSVEGQVALFTYRIQMLSEHLRSNKKDHSCRRSLVAMVAQAIAAVSFQKRYQPVSQAYRKARSS